MRLIDADKLNLWTALRPYCSSDVCCEVTDIIDNAPTVNPYDWISVKDDLPTCHLIRDIFNRPSEYVSDVVLVCVKSTECDGTHYYVSTDMMRGRTPEDVHWMMSCGYGGTAVYYQVITHWMPLPAPPTEKEN